MRQSHSDEQLDMNDDAPVSKKPKWEAHLGCY